MAYIALKPCTFAGQKFKIGDSIPGDLLLPGAVKNLIKMEKIASTDAGNVSVGNGSIVVAISTDDGDMSLGLTPAGLQQIFDVFTANVENAENIIETMTDGDALILLHVCDNRKGVKAAAEARAKALEEPEAEEAEEADGEQESPEEETDDSAGEE